MKQSLATARKPSQSRSSPLKLIKTQHLAREEWLDVRRRGIGSSDAAAAVGLSPYKSRLELWLEKTGRDRDLPKPDPDDDSSPVFWGTVLEPIVATHYSRRTGHRVRRINAVLQHPQAPWMLANIDREVIGAADVQILECKTTGAFGARHWCEGVPEYVQLQVMHQLAVTGKRAADVAVLIAGQELQVHRIERDEALISNLMALEAEFWSFVESDREPPADGSESSARALRCLYACDSDRVLDLRTDASMCQLFDELLKVRDQLSEREAREAQLKQCIQQRMADASRAVFRHGEVSWKRSKDGTQLDTAALVRDHPELVEQYTRPRPGSRRFLVSG